MVLNIDLESRNNAEYSAEYRPGGPNIEPHIRSLNIVLNIDLKDRI